jgi:hypothetical protein
VKYNWDGFGISEAIWAIIMISVGAIVVSLAIYSFRNPFIGLAVIWAFAGIIIKRQEDYRSIVITAIIAIMIVGIITALGFFRKTVV